MSNAPRYRLVGYDIGTAPDENGGWVHWTDHKAIVARLTAERDAAILAVEMSEAAAFSAGYEAADEARQADLSTAARDVLAERARQISVEGWTHDHDDIHAAGQMALAAGCYAMFASASDRQRATADLPGGLATLGKTLTGWSAWLQIWPWDRSWWKPTNRRRDLVKAGALILAEIERLDRAALAQEGGE